MRACITGPLYVSQPSTATPPVSTAPPPPVYVMERPGGGESGEERERMGRERLRAPPGLQGEHVPLMATDTSEVRGCEGCEGDGNQRVRLEAKPVVCG